MAQPAKVINMEEHRSQGPQVEDGFVRIANELFDAFLSFKFSYRQSKVFLAVLRKTFGYGKKSDDVSASQLGALCAMPRSHVASTLVELEKMNAITRSPGKYGTVTAINKNHWQWKKLDDEGEQKGSGGFGGAASRSPCDRRYHYVYRLDSTLSGEFYIGVRSCDCHPNQDRYMGSGCWPATVHKSNLKKTVLSLHETRAEAEEEEKRVIRSMADASDMKNRMRYDTAVACSESEHPLVQNLNSSVVQNLNTPSTESEQLLVQNLNSSVVQNLNTQKTTFQKTTPKDNLKRIAQSADRAASPTADAAFADFWEAFGHKRGKANAKEAFAREYAKAGHAADWLQTVMAAAAKEAQRRPHLIADGQTPIYAQGWLTQRRYEDEGLLAWGAFSAEQKAFIDCFNANIGDTCPQVTEWTEKRAALADIAMRGAWSLEKWGEFWRYVADECQFDWPVSFEWMLSRENWAKVKGGQYLRKEVTA